MWLCIESLGTLISHIKKKLRIKAKKEEIQEPSSPLEVIGESQREEVEETVRYSVEAINSERKKVLNRGAEISRSLRAISSLENRCKKNNNIKSSELFRERKEKLRKELIEVRKGL